MMHYLTFMGTVVVTITVLLPLLASVALAVPCPILVDGKMYEGKLEDYLKPMPKHTLVTVQPNTVPCAGFIWDGPMYIRAHATDYRILGAILYREEFQPLHEKLFANTTLTTVIDLGANVGLASAFLAARYQEATIVAVEADLSNYRVAVLNNMPFADRVHLLYGGVWGQQADYLVIDPKESKAEWGNFVRELRPSDAASCTWDVYAALQYMERHHLYSTPVELLLHCGLSGTELARNPIPAWTVPGIMRRMGWEFVDYVKVDIECSEFSLIKGDLSWLPRARYITMEIHPKHWCGGDKEDIMRTMSEAGFTYLGRHTELHMWSNNRSIPIASVQSRADDLTRSFSGGPRLQPGVVSAVYLDNTLLFAISLLMLALVMAMLLWTAVLWQRKTA